MALTASLLLGVAALCTNGLAINSEVTDDYVEMHNGMAYHRSCIHHHEDHFEVEHLDDGFARIKGEMLGPCPYPPRRISPVGIAGWDEATRVKSEELALYYSDWSVYAQTAGKEYNYMTSRWSVPPIPKKNQGGLSSVYLFNGLEDGNGKHGRSTFILQPVLLYGKSGCLPLAGESHKWHLGSYLVGSNGRAHCGKHFEVHPGQTVVGTMTKQPTGNETWTVESVALPINGGENQTSSYTASLNGAVVNSAYLVLEGMIIYNCQSFPAGGGVTFSDVVLGTKEERKLRTNRWTPMIRHDECKQGTRVNSHEGTSVSLLWDSTTPK